MKSVNDNGLSRYRARLLMAALLACCSGAAAAGVDDVWAASPATQDTQWAQVYAAPVNPINSGGGKPKIYKDSITSYGETAKNLGHHDSCVISSFFADNTSCSAQETSPGQWRIHAKPWANSVTCEVTCYTW